MISFDDNKGKLELKLEAQSPMIHFQARETGATLRASEVKPKLDRFLIEKLKAQDLDLYHEELEKSILLARGDSRTKQDCVPGYFLPDASAKEFRAMNYRMQIFCPEPPTIIVIHNNPALKKNNPGYRNAPDYPIYYGNSGIKEAEKQRLGIISNPTVMIHCFVPGLRKLIADYIEEFFFVTNFGTMQSKGFGSFVPEGSESTPIQMKEWLTEKTGTDICLKMDIPTGQRWGAYDYSNHFQWIERFCRLMKSGVNLKGKPDYDHSFLFEYMHGKYGSGLGIGNEKAWMKEKGISPNVSTRGIAPPMSVPDQPPRYVRALLGAAGSISYQKSERGRMKVKISSQELSRVPSPLFFKIVGNSIYIASFPIDPDVYGKSFTFSGFCLAVLPTPNTEELGGAFDMARFLRAYVAYFNCRTTRSKLPNYLNHAPEVIVL